MPRQMREFTFNGAKLADPNPEWTPEAVKKIHAQAHPELTNATITGPSEINGRLVYEYKKAVGTKG